MKDRTLLKKRVSAIAVYAVILLFIGITQTASAFAVTRTWDGGGATNNWSDAANWSGDVAPTSADDAVFNATSVKNATIDQSFTVSTLQLQSGYSGTVTQGAGANLTININYTQAAGTFQGSDGNFTYSNGISTISGGTFTGGTGTIGYTSGAPYFYVTGGSFSAGGNATFYFLNHTGGTFTAPAGTTTINARFDSTAGTFNANGGTFLFNNVTIINAPGRTFNNFTINSGYNVINSPTPMIVAGTLSLVDGTLNSYTIRADGNVSYASTFDGGSTQIEFSDAATRTVNLPASGTMLAMLINNPNITVKTDDAATSTIIGYNTEVRSGKLVQGNAALNFGRGAVDGGNSFILNVTGGTFQGSSAALNFNNNGGLYLSGGSFQGGTGLFSGAFGILINQSGGTFSTQGDVNVTSFTLSGGTFNSPAGIFTVIADWTHATGGAFNAGGGTVKFTGYSVFNCANSMTINVNVTETFNNLQFANQGCNTRYISSGDTLIVNGALSLAYNSVNSGRVRPLGTIAIDSSFSGNPGSTIAEFITPNANFVINNPATTVSMLGIEMNAANSTLTSSGAGKINFYGATLLNGTLNQPSAIWDFATYPGYTQSGGIFNGSASQLNISNGAVSGNALTGGTFNGGSGLINGGWSQSGGTFSTPGNMNVGQFTLTGGTFNAPLGTLDLFNGFAHTTATGTFNARTGTVQTSGLSGVYGISFDVNAAEIFNNLKFNGTYNNANHLIAANDTLIVNGALNFNGRGVSGGSIVANGDVFYTSSGGYQNATTLVKFQDAATRTITFSNDCTSYFQPTLVDNPNITVNTGCDTAGAVLQWTSLDLRQGTVNAGNARSGFTGDFSQSGGTFNAGNNAVSPATSIGGNFTLSGGDFNAAPSTSFAANYTHTASGGNFNYGTGTVIFNGTGGTIDVNTSENFNNVNVQMNAGNTKTIASGDRLIVNGNLALQGGYVSGGIFDAKKNVSVTPQFSGGSTALNFTGATDQIFTNSGGITTNGIWTVNKPASISAVENNFAAAAPTNLLVSGNIGNNANATLVPLNVVAGNVVQTGNYNQTLASLNVAAGASYVNQFAGTLTLGGDVANAGVIDLNANGAGCQADSILIRSTNATQRNWAGNGMFTIVDSDVSGQSGTPTITVYNGTNSGNNGANWVFNSTCLAPTAAGVSISGRVLTANGRGIANVIVALTDAQGISKIAVSNIFGFYKFSDVAAGQTVVLAPRGKKFSFEGQTQILNLSDNLSGINFTAADR